MESRDWLFSYMAKPSKSFFNVFNCYVNFKNYRAAYLSFFISMCLKVDTDSYYSQKI